MEFIFRYEHVMLFGFLYLSSLIFSKQGVSIECGVSSVNFGDMLIIEEFGVWLVVDLCKKLSGENHNFEI